MDLSPTQAAWFWFGFGLILAAAEIFLPSFFMLFAALATLAPLAMALFNFGLSAQLASFGLAMAVSLFFVRPLLVKKIKKGKEVPSRSDRLMGARGHVTQKIDPSIGPGRVLVMGEDWAAFSKIVLAEGAAVEVIGADGIVLEVIPEKEHTHRT